MAAPAAFQGQFEHADQVLGLFVDFHLEIADDAEDPQPVDAESREQPIEEQPHHVFER